MSLQPSIVLLTEPVAGNWTVAKFLVAADCAAASGVCRAVRVSWREVLIEKREVWVDSRPHNVRR